MAKEQTAAKEADILDGSETERHFKEDRPGVPDDGRAELLSDDGEAEGWIGDGEPDLDDGPDVSDGGEDDESETFVREIRREARDVSRDLVSAFAIGLSYFSGISSEAMYRRLHQRTEIVHLTEGDDDLLDGTGFEALNPEILPKSELDED